ncbi:MAG: RNase adapter RapZ [Gammaproteobacteria bacterium]|nr:MAG: RNase adapter RapZ [Gammaproteobacteria bacterium]
MRLIIISGLSGSGKSVALNQLEDLGFYCIDNVPAALLDKMVSELVASGDPVYENLAFGMDARSRPRDLEALPALLKDLRERGIRSEVIFLQAADDILLKRYAETRRKHPLSTRGHSLREAIAQERQLLGPIIDCAELVLDTTGSSVYELRDKIRERVGLRSQPGMSILIESFGFKHGLPADADFVFDLRCLPNPYWDLTLRPLTGRDRAVIDYLEASAEVQAMYQDILDFLLRWIPKYLDFNRNYLTVALGCTGGQHRSVYMADKLAAALGQRYDHVLTRHTELPAGQQQAADPGATG